MILDQDNTVQPETTSTNEPSVAKLRARVHYFTHKIEFFFFRKQKNFDPPGSSNKRLSIGLALLSEDNNSVAFTFIASLVPGARGYQATL